MDKDLLVRVAGIGGGIDMEAKPDENDFPKEWEDKIAANLKSIADAIDADIIRQIIEDEKKIDSKKQMCHSNNS